MGKRIPTKRRIRKRRSTGKPIKKKILGGQEMVELPSVLLKFIKKVFKELSAYYSQYDSGKKGNKISLFIGDFLKFVEKEKDLPKVEWPDVKEMKELD